jgi:hypothetical protein
MQKQHAKQPLRRAEQLKLTYVHVIEKSGLSVAP